MLDLTNGGRCISGLDAIEFMERLADVFDEDVKTDEFCEEYERALNRFRYEIGKSVPVKPRRVPGRTAYYTCGQCGHGVSRCTDKFCGGCGRAIDWKGVF